MIGDNIRKALESKGITSNELAKRIGVSVPYISYLLNNKRNASIETLEKIAMVLEVNVSDFFEDEPKGANILLENITDDLNKLNELYNKNPYEDLKRMIEVLEGVANKVRGLVKTYNEAISISSTGEKNKMAMPDTKQKLEAAQDSYKEIKTVISKLINDYTLHEELLKLNDIDDIDEYMKAIIVALKHASPNKKAKILKMIELFDDEN